MLNLIDRYCIILAPILSENADLQIFENHRIPAIFVKSLEHIDIKHF